MKAHHTGTKWEIEGESESGKYIIVKANTGRTVARIPWSPQKEAECGLATDHYDAKLIAAAPELIEALQQLQIGIKNSSDPGMMYYVNGIEKLIKKATE